MLKILAKHNLLIHILIILIYCEHLFYFRIIYGEQLNIDGQMFPDLVIHSFFQGSDLLRLHGGSVQFNVASLTPQFPKT